MTGDRCDYIESCITRIYGKGALQQQEILEIGCGGGLICEQLARRKATMVGIDPSEGALAEARAHARQSGLGNIIYYEQASAEALPYADGSFSVIICLDVLEHVRDLKATIAEIARVVLIWYGEHFPSGLVKGIHNYHDFIKPAELRALLEANELRVPELTGFMPRGLVDGHFKMGPGWFIGVSYVGYATKLR